ncbi:hypothetical protein A4H02_00805 [Fervidobacterium thailandense]|uniref:Uncharacterized protein n=1 Tax=Fervidobacterium thailandense TaxID=1008305 RepID=A0A1E3G594_9BACT|nr:hypothetical protein A4H02_00805 [Fervidobacterium thailandense]
MQRLLRKAIELTRLGKLEEAKVIYEKLLPYEIPEVYNNLGNIYRREGLLAKAVEMYRKAILLEPRFALAYFNMGCTFMELERYSEAIMFLEKAQSLGFEGFDLEVQLALCYLAVGDVWKAKKKMEDPKVYEEVRKFVDGGIDI